MAAQPTEKILEPPTYTELEKIMSTNQKVKLHLIVYDDKTWDKENPSND